MLVFKSWNLLWIAPVPVHCFLVTFFCSIFQGLSVKKQMYGMRQIFSWSRLIIAPAYSKVRYRGSTFRPFVRSFVQSSFVRPSVRPSVRSVHNSCQGALLCSSDSWEYETLHSNYPWHTLQAGTLTQCPWPWFHAPLTLSKFCVESRKFMSSLEIKFISLQQC